MNFTDSYSDLSKNMKASKIRELMKYSSMPGVISFSGGMPDPENFPVRDIKEIISSWDGPKARTAMQYGTTIGYGPLIENLKKRMAGKGMDLAGQELIITTGAQQALFLLSRVFIDKGDTILMEDPTFIGGMASFLSSGAHCRGITLEHDGIDTGELLEKLDSLHKQNIKPKFLYLIPNFQNPAGVTLSQEKRKEVHRISLEYNLIIIEDDPYCDLYFEGTPGDYKPIKALPDSDNVIYLGSFSKILCPGFRLGWAFGATEIIEKMGLVKQSVDACSSSFGQVVANDYLENGVIDGYLTKMRAIYKEKKEFMTRELSRRLPPSIKATDPKGGFFIYLTLPDDMSADALFKRVIKKNVAFVTGEPFHTDPEKGDRHIRLSYSNSSLKEIEEGISILADAIEKYST